MKYRSWLVVPGNSAEQLGAAMGTGADVIVVDLEGTVPVAQKAMARKNAAEWLAAHRYSPLGQRFSRWVRINSLESGLSYEDLVAVIGTAPDGIVLPKVAEPETVRQIAAQLYELEQRNGIQANSTRMLPVLGESARSALSIAGHLERGHQRVIGLTWAPVPLAAELRASRTQDAAGEWTDAFRFVRAQTLLTAHAGGYHAIEAASPVYEDLASLSVAARIADADGFAGMFASHPAQVPTINAAFAPEAEVVAAARAVIAAFQARPDAGSLAIAGRMVEQSQLDHALRIVAEADAAQAAETRRTPILRSA